jgi:hypothetical protein
MIKGRVIFCFDIEARGKSPKNHGIMAVGVVIGKEDGTILYKKQWNVNELHEHQTFDKRCYNEFWNKQPTEIF